MTTVARLRVLRLRWLALLGVAPVLAIACGGTTYVATPCEVSEDFGDGTEMCAQGYRHRTASVACAEAFPAAANGCELVGGTCAADSDCGGGETCSERFGCECLPGCQTDADCAAAEICSCEGQSSGICIASDCRSDADCGAGFECVATDDFTFFFCQGPDDECTTSQDCGEAEACLVDSGVLVCVGGSNGCGFGCQEGRPFLIDGQARTAPLAARSDWTSALASSLGLADVPAELRDSLAAHWADVGLMEHASIAAFARLSLQLLSLGAPPELVERAGSAMRDETEHARIAFALASAYGRRPIGPGPLVLAGALEDSDLATLVRLAIREGCVGETAAAMVLEEGANAAVSAPLAELLGTIAADETGHAELAWLTVHWALEQEPETIARVIREEMTILGGELAGPEGGVTDSDDARLADHGVLGEGRFAALRRHSIRELVLPILASLIHPWSASARLVA